MRISILVLFCIYVVSCKPTQAVVTHPLALQHTWPEVLAIAQRHGVDSTYLPYAKQSGLMLYDEAQIVEHALNTKRTLDYRKQNAEFTQNCRKIRNYADYEALMARYPLVLEAHQKAASGSEVAIQFVCSLQEGVWHIYRDTISGTLRWVNPEDDLGAYGAEERLDNLPPVGIGN